MKKLLLGLLSLSLVLAFAMPAAAVDVSATGSFYIYGLYEDNRDLLTTESGSNGSSSAYYGQRLRIETTFKVNPALKLVTRFDALEGYWSGASGPTEYASGDEDNIDFDRAYMEVGTKYGLFSLGYMSGGVWGTIFADAEVDVSRIKWVKPLKGWVVGAVVEKAGEYDRGTASTDKDNDKYMAFVVKPFKGGVAGLLYVNVDYAVYKASYDINYHILEPYVKAKFGNLYVEAEVDYAFGDSKDYVGNTADVDKDSISFYANAKYTLGNAYVGGQVAFVEGNDPNTNDDEGGTTGGDYSPCLILYNDDLYKWSGSSGLGADLDGANYTTDVMMNAWLYQIYAGMAVTPKLSLFASYTYAKADEQFDISSISSGTTTTLTTTKSVDDEIGSEFDFTATYKIMNGLDYMVGFGYFWTGDWYKGSTATNQVDDNYLVINKLTLTF